MTLNEESKMANEGTINEDLSEHYSSVENSFTDNFSP